MLHKALRAALLGWLTGCGAMIDGTGAGGGGDATGGGSVAAGGGSAQTCNLAAPQVVPLYAPGPSETGPIVARGADGTITTTAAGRVRPRHEREDRHMAYEPHYFENRSYRFVVEDRVAAGKSELVISYYPVADPSMFGPNTNFRAWKVYGAPGNGPQSYLFADNGSLTTVGPRYQVKTITRNARDNRPLRVGDIFDFEFGVFIMGFDSQDPATIGEGAKSYYTDTFRYRVGQGGLTPETFDTAGLVGPSVEARLGGDTTVPHIAYADGAAVAPALAFSQLALNTQAPHQQHFLEGRRLFNTRFDTGAHVDPRNPIFTAQVGKLGPLFNAVRCATCHVNNGRGTLPALGAPVEALVLKLDAASPLGTQVQNQEATVKVSRYDARDVRLADGTVVALRKPIFESGMPLKASPRIARQLVGMGLLEALDEASVLALADENDCDGDGISGRPSLVKDPLTGQQRLGRFGWKAEKVSVEHQVADALDADMGVTTRYFPHGAAPELADADLDHLATYMRLLGVLPQRNAAAANVQRGEAIFSSIGCSNCHRASATTGTTHPYEELRAQRIKPFTDLLLHDMGPDLADETGMSSAAEWRTAPLWGVGFTREVSGTVNLLHDGRAGSVLEAVLWHGGEAKAARDAVVAGSKDDREALISFVESL